MTEEKRPYVKQGKNFDELIGSKYNFLTITEIVPRERDERGRLKPPECVVECECGTVKTCRIYDVVNSNILSCGCHRGKRGFERDKNVPATILMELNAKIFCPYTTPQCVRSSKLHLCCRECDRLENCPVACVSTPEGCGAKYRSKKIDHEEFGIW